MGAKKVNEIDQLLETLRDGAQGFVVGAGKGARDAVMESGIGRKVRQIRAVDEFVRPYDEAALQAAEKAREKSPWAYTVGEVVGRDPQNPFREIAYRYAEKFGGVKARPEDLEEQALEVLRQEAVRRLSENKKLVNTKSGESPKK